MSFLLRWEELMQQIRDFQDNGLLTLTKQLEVVEKCIQVATNYEVRAKLMAEKGCIEFKINQVLGED